MEKKEIICSYCGTAKKIQKSDLNKDIFCGFCRSSLNNLVKEVLNEELPKNSEQIKSQDAQSNPFPVYKETPVFPSSQSTKRHKHKVQPIRAFPFQVGVQNQSRKQKKSILIFPQINKRIPFPENKSIFYFGRQSILPLVSASQFDVEWLNSISRIRRQNNQISKQHFKIRRDNSGKFFIEDRESRWGTWVNRRQIKGKGDILLRNGDKIELMLSKPNVKNVIPFVIQFQC